MVTVRVSEGLGLLKGLGLTQRIWVTQRARVSASFRLAARESTPPNWYLRSNMLMLNMSISRSLPQSLLSETNIVELYQVWLAVCSPLNIYSLK